MKQLVLKLDVNDEQVLNIALGRIARTSGNYKINMNKTTKLCTVTGDNIDPIQIVRKLRMLCRVDIVAVETPIEPEKKKEELVEVVNASSLHAAVGPSKEPTKEDELRKEEPSKQEELVEEVVNASSRAAAAGPSKEPKKKEEELEEEELEEEEPKKQEEKKKGEVLITDVKEDPNKTFRAPQMKKVVFKVVLHDEKAKKKAMMKVSKLPGVDSISMDMKDMKMTVIGDIDAVQIVTTLKKLCFTEIISFGPAKEPEKKEEPGEHYEDPVAELVKAYKSYNPNMPPYYYAIGLEEDSNACAIN